MVAFNAHGRARVDTRNPSAWGVCDNCSEWRNLSDLAWEEQWMGPNLMRTGFRVCRDRCLDVPQPQLRTIILPPDPIPVRDPRPELYVDPAADWPSMAQTQQPASLGPSASNAPVTFPRPYLASQLNNISDPNFLASADTPDFMGTGS